MSDRRGRRVGQAVLVWVALVLASVGALAGNGAGVEPLWSSSTVSIAELRVLDAQDVTGVFPSRVVLQVIDNVFHKWSEYDVGDEGGFFIVQHDPVSRSLTAAEARVLLEASSTWMTQQPPADAGFWLSPGDLLRDARPVGMWLAEEPGTGKTDGTGDDEAVYWEAPEGSWDRTEPSAAPVETSLVQTRALGTDDRRRVTNTTSYPWNTIGYCEAQFPHQRGTSQGGRGTGFLIAPYTVLTNAHNLYSAELGGHAISFRFVPGLRQDGEGQQLHIPYGYQDFRSAAVSRGYVDAGPTPGGRVTVRHIMHDYGAAFLSTPFPGITTFMPLEWDYSPAVGSTINVAGYPGQVRGERDSHAMWHCTGRVLGVDPRILEYDAYTSGGNSGGPVWRYSSQTGLRRVIAVHSFGSDIANGGPRLVTANRNLIEQWMRWTPGPQPPTGLSHTYENRAGWYMISFPATASLSPGTTVDRWNPARGAWDRVSTIQATHGYWARLGASASVTLTGVSIPTGDVTLALNVAGWHQISTPWMYPRSAIRVTRAGVTRTWADAVAAGWIRNAIYGFRATDGAYTTPTTLHPWYGYWMEARVSGLTLRFVYASRTTLMDGLSGWDETVAPLVLELAGVPPLPVDLAGVGAKLQVANVPNPITDVYTTTFRVLGPVASSVTGISVSVYDLAGKLVWQGSAAGAELTWHTADLAGRYLANGVYIYQITAQVAGTTVTSGLMKLSILR